jgi:outer membrane protein assembly factor BamB
MHRSLTALIALSLTSSAVAQPGDGQQVLGWWRATLSHVGESHDIWLHFSERDGQLMASFSNPMIAIDDSPLSKVAVQPQSVELGSIGWTLRRDGRALVGVIPDVLVPVYKLKARFVRSGPPPRPPVNPRPAQNPPRALWTQNLRSAVFGGLAFDAARNRLIAATDSGDVAALRANDGAIAWSVDAGAAIRATPLVAGASLYVPTDKALLKLDLATGRRLWASSLGKGEKRLAADDPKSRGDHYSSSAIVAGDSVYAGSRDGCVYRFNAESGATVGRYCATDLITATPVVDGPRVYFASFDRSVYAAERDTGHILWKRDLHGAVPRDLALAGHNILAGSRSYDLAALDKTTGKPSWNRYYWYSWVDSPPNVVGPTVYIGSSDSLRLFAFDAGSGKKLWESRVPGWSWAKPAVGRTTVYASVTGPTNSYAGARLGAFVAIDRDSGKLRWIIQSPKRENAAVYGFASAPVIAQGRVFAADLDGRIFAFKED